jgi:hypothetical protein
MLARAPDVPLPPICAWNTFQIGVLDYFKAHPLPAFIVSGSLPAVALGLRVRVITSLRALKLIDGQGRVQETLRKLIAVRGTGHWEAQVRALMADAYPYLSGLNLAQTDSIQLRRAFIAYLRRETDNLSKCEAFYINLAHTGGFELSEALKKRVGTAETMATFKAGQKQEIVMPSKSAGIAVQPPRLLRRVLAPSATPRSDQIKPEAASLSKADRVEKIMDLLRLFIDEGIPAKELQAVLTLLDYAKRKAAESQ